MRVFDEKPRKKLCFMGNPGKNWVSPNNLCAILNPGKNWVSQNNFSAILNLEKIGFSPIIYFMGNPAHESRKVCLKLTNLQRVMDKS